MERPFQPEEDFVSERQDLKSLDIIIVNFESTDYVIRLIGSVYDVLDGLAANILVQDNASRDRVERIKDLFPKVVLTRNRTNIGFAKAANRAIQHSRSPYIFLLNPDVTVSRGFFDSIIGYMEEHPDVGIVGPRILNPDGSLQGSARSFPSLSTSLFGRSSLLTRCYPNNPISRKSNLSAMSDGRTPMKVDWLSGACMAVRRRAVDEVGRLDERFFIYWEDVDWCKRMLQKGWQVVYLPKATAVHHVGGSSGKRPIRCILDFHKSCYRFLEKHNHPSVRFGGPLVIGLLSLRLVVSLLVNRIGAGSVHFRSLISNRENPVLRQNGTQCLSSGIPQSDRDQAVSSKNGPKPMGKGLKPRRRSATCAACQKGRVESAKSESPPP